MRRRRDLSIRASRRRGLDCGTLKDCFLADGPRPNVTIVRKLRVGWPLLAVLVLLAGTAAASDDFEARFGQILGEHGVPGGSFAVVRGDRITHAAGYGVRAAGESAPITVDTVFRVASVSKTFAAQLTAMLVAEGRLDWDNRIVEFEPRFTLARPDHAARLEIRHVLGQSSGIVPNAYDNLLNASQPLARIVPRFAELEPLCEPGQCYTYQNVLFGLIETAIEQRAGEDYATLLQQRLFEPLDMHNASSGIDGFRASPDRARPHVQIRKKSWRATGVNENYYRVAPAAGVNASALDLGRWLIAQMGHRPDVIAPQLAEHLTRRGVRTRRDLRRRGWRDLLSDAHYGLGWRIYTVGDDVLYLHSGWVRGFVAEVAYSRDRQVGLAVLLNAETAALNDVTTAFWREELNKPHPSTLADAEVSAPTMGGD